MQLWGLQGRRMGGPGGKHLVRGSPRASQRRPPRVPTRSQPRARPGPAVPARITPSTCPRDVGPLLAGQHPSAWPGPPAVPWDPTKAGHAEEAAAGALGPEQPPGSCCGPWPRGSAGSPVGPARRVALDGAHPSAVRPHPSVGSRAQARETPSLGLESDRLQRRAQQMMRYRGNTDPLPPRRRRCDALRAGGAPRSKPQVRLARRPGTPRTGPQVTGGTATRGGGISLQARSVAPAGNSGTPRLAEVAVPRAQSSSHWDCPQVLQPHSSMLDQFRKKPRLSVGAGAGCPRARAHLGESGPQWTGGQTGSPGPEPGDVLCPLPQPTSARRVFPEGDGGSTPHGASGPSVDSAVKWAGPESLSFLRGVVGPQTENRPG